MIHSMTGYGRAEGFAAGWHCCAELRSVNNRFLEARLRLPHGLQNLEEPLKKQLRGACERGKVEGSITLAPEPGGPPPLKVDRPMLERYATLLREVQQVTGLPLHLTVADLLGSQEALLRSGWEDVAPQVRQLVQTCFDQALGGLLAMRRQEGAALEAELRSRMALLREHVASIAPLARDLPLQQARRLQEHLQRLAALAPAASPGGGTAAGAPAQGGGTPPASQDARILTEIALLAERSDVTEEIARLGAHLEHLELLLRQGGPLGKKIEFLLQELNREANTLSVKCSDAQVSAHVIEIKSELERLREQIQNIE